MPAAYKFKFFINITSIITLSKILYLWALKNVTLEPETSVLNVGS